MKRLALLFLLASRLSAQTMVMVHNNSFEQNSLKANWDTETPAGWTCPNAGGGHGLLAPTPAQVSSGVDGTTVLWVMQGSNCSQDVGSAVPGTNYLLTLQVGSQNGFTGVYTLSYGGCSVSGTTTIGSLVPVTLPCPVPSGELIVSLVATSGQVLFDKVVLTSTPITPPSYTTFQFPGQLFTCTVCDGKTPGDDSSTAIGIFAGASIALTQDGQNVCGSMLNTSAQTMCSGPINTVPTTTNLSMTVCTPDGKTCYTQSYSFPEIWLVGRGIITVVFRLDSVNMSIPRGLQVYTE